VPLKCFINTKVCFELWYFDDSSFMLWGHVADNHYPASLLHCSQRLHATTPLDSCRNRSHVSVWRTRIKQSPSEPIFDRKDSVLSVYASSTLIPVITLSRRCFGHADFVIFIPQLFAIGMVNHSQTIPISNVTSSIF
jgi:hypothetical protein